MAITTGMLIFDDAEELDFVGPWEVFTAAAKMRDGDRVVHISKKREEPFGKVEEFLDLLDE